MTTLVADLKRLLAAPEHETKQQRIAVFVEGHAAEIIAALEKPRYKCSTCGLDIVLDVIERRTLNCPDCKTYTAQRVPPA